MACHYVLECSAIIEQQGFLPVCIRIAGADTRLVRSCDGRQVATPQILQVELYGELIEAMGCCPALCTCALAPGTSFLLLLGTRFEWVDQASVLRCCFVHQ